MLSHPPKTWLALTIGNSRLHWGLFNQQTLIQTWDTNYLTESEIRSLAENKTLEQILFHPPIPPLPPLFIASVVPQQTELWQNYPKVNFISLKEIPLNNLYPTLGIDRALALLGAGETWTFPTLVIDAGTALTFTGADSHRNLIGGAILPGLGLQLATLSQKTGQLPKVELSQQLPQRYAQNTNEAIQSGIIYTLLAGIKDFIAAWLQDYPASKIVITGGDRNLLFTYLKSQFPEIAAGIIVEQNLILWGIQKIKS
ncbi:MAG: pantothenate kinase [Richelia sp. RM2_1_2]|nr:pantothenate kinase [Richelia sp. SM1_7_0]NJN07251.1 pantothenate kinase [Richelia sp. RM1_1_1]NJO27861.1 pantothenate kinase [Richelia sp. SL_2_1]NJO57504.1 pantothenate kinase [Richelia sp. RM2_1_2]